MYQTRIPTQEPLGAKCHSARPRSKAWHARPRGPVISPGSTEPTSQTRAAPRKSAPARTAACLETAQPRAAGCSPPSPASRTTMPVAILRSVSCLCPPQSECVCRIRALAPVRLRETAVLLPRYLASPIMIHPHPGDGGGPETGEFRNRPWPSQGRQTWVTRLVSLRSADKSARRWQGFRRRFPSSETAEAARWSRRCTR